MGHTDETYKDPLFLNHLWAGIHYVTGGDSPKPLDYAMARPEENRFTKVVLAEKLGEPIPLLKPPASGLTKSFENYDILSRLAENIRVKGKIAHKLENIVVLREYPISEFCHVFFKNMTL